MTEYLVYDAHDLIDVIKLTSDQKKLFEAENPHFRLEKSNNISWEDFDVED